MHRRFAVSLPAFAALILLLTLAATRCGSDKDKKSTPGPTPTTKTSTSTTGAPTEVAPADWDGAQDWSGNAYEVIEE